MKLAILSQNIQGMNDANKVGVVQNYFRSHLHETDIICLQETKLRGAKHAALKDLMWRGAGFFGQEASPAYNNEANPDGAGSGGTD